MFGGRGKQGALSVRQVNERFQHWRREAGLEDGRVGPMRLRVSYATMLHQQSGDVALVAQSLGQSLGIDVRSTIRHEAAREEMAGAGERLMERLGLG